MNDSVGCMFIYSRNTSQKCVGDICGKKCMKGGNFCRNHKKPKCQVDKCCKGALYNYTDQNKGIYCFEHKMENMINITTINKRCQREGCIRKQPIFNYAGQRKGIYCSEHKIVGMIDVLNKRCEYDGCTKKQVFNYEHCFQRLYCT